MSIHIPKAYGGVALLSTLITGGCLVTGDLERVQRLAAFNEDFMDINFTEKHQKEVGDDPAQQGYPDDGNGRYMQAKSYADWYFFNVAKRVYRNDLEHIVVMVPCNLLNGVFMPYQTIGIMGMYLIGR